MLHLSSNLGPSALPQASADTRVLMIDVGGTNVKLRVSGREEMLKFPSGRELSAKQMVEQTLQLTSDWAYDCISLGFPGLVRDGIPAREPLNLGGGWLGFDFAGALGRPVRIVNDAVLQATAAYEGGRMLFVGLGTSIGCALAMDGIITNIEVGLIPLGKEDRFVDRLNKAARRERGQEKWQRDVYAAVTLLKDMFWPDETVIGGGNAKHLYPLPAGCRRTSNRDALRGAERLWDINVGRARSLV